MTGTRVRRFAATCRSTLWNTCPFCICYLIPVLVVGFSVAFRLDYATHVNDAGAQAIRDMGLSYTVYYTAGCWPEDGDATPAMSHSGFPGDAPPPVPRSSQCDKQRFEIAAGEFDALSGSLLRVQNVTKLHATKVDAVKVTPDGRYIIFIGALANDLGNLYAVGATKREAVTAVPLLNERHLDVLDEQCQQHSEEVLSAAHAMEGIAASPATAAGRKLPRQSPMARLAGFKQLQVIIAGIAPIAHGDLELPTVPQPTAGSSLAYRAAFAFDCAEVSAMDPRGGPSGVPLRFSKLAVVDFQLLGQKPARSGAYARAQLHVVDPVTIPPKGAKQVAAQAVDRLKSQSCPRFVPSKLGHELLFVAEDLGLTRQPPNPSLPSWLPSPVLPSRWLALTMVPVSPQHARMSPVVATGQGRRLQEKPTAAASRATAAKHFRTPGITSTIKAINAGSSAILLDVGEGALPRAPVSGCPEFVPSLYLRTADLVETVSDNVFQRSAEHAPAQLAARRELQDTFIILSEPSSGSVLGIDAQLLAVSLPQGPTTGAVSRVRLLYNVENAPLGSTSHALGKPAQLRMSGCQPIRAAGRKGHMRLQSVMEALTSTLRLPNDKSGYASWLACLTADQRVALLDSPKWENWINMSMPYPTWTGKLTQDIWCPREREEACFEVWLNPNPNG